MHPRYRREIPLWKGVGEADWNYWKWQVANRITTVEQFREVIEINEEEAASISPSLGRLRMAIAPCYVSLMGPKDPSCQLRIHAVHTEYETKISKADLQDPLSLEPEHLDRRERNKKGGQA